jgi:hypothetical protein
MGIDGFSFDSQVEGKKRFGEEPSNLCACGKDMVNHTLKEKRVCRPKSKEALLAAEGAG